MHGTSIIIPLYMRNPFKNFVASSLWEAILGLGIRFMAIIEGDGWSLTGGLTSLFVMGRMCKLHSSIFTYHMILITASILQSRRTKCHLLSTEPPFSRNSGKSYSNLIEL